MFYLVNRFCYPKSHLFLKCDTKHFNWDNMTENSLKIFRYLLSVSVVTAYRDNFSADSQ